MATEPRTTRLMYQDLQRFPEDNFRRELIGGELIVTAAPGTRHQNAVLRLGATLLAWVDEHGGQVFVAPFDVYLSERDVVEPDVLFVRQEHLDRLSEQYLRGAPDVIVEVSSPSTRRLELRRKKDLYERYGAAEYWYVDLESDRVEVHRLEEARYGAPRLLMRQDVLDSPEVPGFYIPVDDLLGPADD